MIAPRPERLSLLAEKYETLARLRRDKSTGAALPDKSVFVALNARFPGALVELDRLDEDEICLRASRLRAALAGASAVEDWMTAVDLYHALVLEGLALRVRARSTGPVSRDALAEAAARIAAELGADVTPHDLELMVSAQTRRLVPVVLALVSRLVDAPRERVAALLGRGLGRTALAPLR
ncbi:MAG TPA: hypothetical protein VL400_00925 [Polyangiaceae bacterium]|nr:hypothetical protein [Polyangiaceae bacterium]